MIKGKDVTLTFKSENGEELKMRASDFKVDSEIEIDYGSVARMATPEEAQRRADALNRQPRGVCVMAGCEKERAAWTVSDGCGQICGVAYCEEHRPKIDV